MAHLAGWTGILQADAYGGYGDLYATGRQPAPVLEASCWAHSRRKVFELADVEAAARKKAHGEKPNLVYPLAVEAVKRIDALFDIERAINGLLPAQRHAVRQERSAAGHRAQALDDRDARQALAGPRPDQGLQLHAAPLVILHPVPQRSAHLPIQQCCRSEPCAASLSEESPGCSAVPIAADSALPFSIVSAKMNHIDPQARLADVLARLPAYPAHRIDDLLPWNCRSAKLRTQPAAA